jgi:hypothetical protein
MRNLGVAFSLVCANPCLCTRRITRWPVRDWRRRDKPSDVLRYEPAAGPDRKTSTQGNSHRHFDDTASAMTQPLPPFVLSGAEYNPQPLRFDDKGGRGRYCPAKIPALDSWREAMWRLADLWLDEAWPRLLPSSGRGQREAPSSGHGVSGRRVRRMRRSPGAAYRQRAHAAPPSPGRGTPRPAVHDSVRHAYRRRGRGVVGRRPISATAPCAGTRNSPC